MFRTTLDVHSAHVHKIYESMPFNKGEVKFFSFVATDKTLSLPALDALMGKTDVREIMDGLKPAISEVTNHIWESVLIRNIRKRHKFTFGDTGKALLNVVSEDPPTQIDWLMLVVEIDEDIRDIGNKAKALVEDSALEDVAKNIAVISALPFGTTAMAAFSIATSLIRGIGSIMADNNNDQVGYIDQSFLLGDDINIGIDNCRTGVEVQDLTANMWYNYRLCINRIDTFSHSIESSNTSDAVVLNQAQSRGRFLIP